MGRAAWRGRLLRRRHAGGRRPATINATIERRDVVICATNDLGIWRRSAEFRWRAIRWRRDDLTLKLGELT